MDDQQYQQEMEGTLFIAKDFLRNGLGIEASPENIQLFINYIHRFEHEVAARHASKQAHCALFRAH